MRLWIAPACQSEAAGRDFRFRIDTERMYDMRCEMCGYGFTADEWMKGMSCVDCAMVVRTLCSWSELIPLGLET